ncbi:MAG: cyclase family protein, partial [Bacteroidia bacterium]|nr:cyclase family protein [Bacteroidia bacterium]
MIRGVSLAVKLDFTGRQLSAFGAPPARAETYQAGEFVGCVADGGPCNCETYRITPHCNGTHTECVGHLTAQKIFVCDLDLPPLMACCVASVIPGPCRNDEYHPRLSPDDKVVEAGALQAAMQRSGWRPGIPALVVRTRREIFGDLSAFFSNDAMRWIRKCAVEHLLVDFASVDKADDDGKLSNHRIFWDLPQDRRIESARSERTITEMIFVPDEIEDGLYALNLRPAAW